MTAITDNKHVAIIGSSGSGKTYMAKKLIPSMGYDNNNVVVFCPDASAAQWSSDGYNTSDRLWDLEERKAHAKDRSSSLYIFDDFWGEVKMSHNNNFRDMFKTVRHLRIRLLLLIHSVTDIPDDVRENIKHVFIPHVNNIKLIQKLCASYMRNDPIALRDAIDKCQGSNNMVYLDVSKNDISVVNANDYDTDSNAIDTKGGSATGANITKVNTGNVLDQSVTNNAISIDQTLNTTQTLNNENIRYMESKAICNMNIDKMKIEHNYEIKNIEMGNELREILYGSEIGYDQSTKAVGLLSKLCKSTRVNQHNMESYAKQFLGDESYELPQQQSKVLQLASGAIKGDNKLMLEMAYNYAMGHKEANVLANIVKSNANYRRYTKVSDYVLTNSDISDLKSSSRYTKPGMVLVDSLDRSKLYGHFMLKFIVCYILEPKKNMKEKLALLSVVLPGASADDLRNQVESIIAGRSRLNRI